MSTRGQLRASGRDIRKAARRLAREVGLPLDNVDTSLLKLMAEAAANAMRQEMIDHDGIDVPVIVMPWNAPSASQSPERDTAEMPSPPPTGAPRFSEHVLVIAHPWCKS
jgi:hypothetical protein